MQNELVHIIAKAPLSAAAWNATDAATYQQNEKKKKREKTIIRAELAGQDSILFLAIGAHLRKTVDQLDL